MRVVVPGMFGIVIALVAVAPVHAAPGESQPAPPVAAVQAPSVVLEAHVGERSSETGELLAPLLRALQGYGFAVRPREIAQLLKGRIARPGILDVGKTADDISQQIVVGVDAYNRGRFKEAVDALTLAVRQIKRNPALLVLDATNSKATFDAFVQLSLAQVKLGQNAEGAETMGELIRMSSTPVSRTAYGPQAEQFYRSVLKQVQGLGRGSLAVTVNDPRAVIFLDGQYRGIAKVLLGDLIPGSHSVLVQVPSTGSRQYEVEIKPDAQATLDVDWRVDSALIVGEPWASFVFASELERTKEAAYAANLVRRWGDANVVLIGMTRIGGTPCVIGTLYHPGVEGPRGAFVPLSDGPEGLRSLARFLYDGSVSGNLSVVSRPGVAAKRPESPASPRAGVVTGAKFVMGAGAATAIAGGLVYIANRDQIGHLLPQNYAHTRAVTLGAIFGGSVLFGGGGYAWMREAHSVEVLPSVLTAAGGTAFLAGGMWYLLASNPVDGPNSIGSTTPGLIMAGTGVVLTGIGLWLWHRDSETATATAVTHPRSRSIAWAMPTLSVEPSRATVALVGSF